MEQKPIKRNEHILQHSKDHHFTLLFCWKIRQGIKRGVDAERIKKYVQHFWQQNMVAHFREEEDILFAPLKDEKVQRAIEEHEQIKEQVNAVLQSSGEEASKQLILIANLVDKHVRYEERELYPHLEKMLTYAQLENIGIHLLETPVLKDDYADEFWVSKN